MTLELRLILYAILGLGIAGGIVYWDVHERHQGLAQCQKADVEAAQREAQRYKEQLDYATEQLAKDEELLHAVAGSPVPVLVCHKASAKQATPTADSEPATAGVPDPVRQPDFDPSTDLRNLSAGYEGRVEAARDALRKCPK